MLVQRLMRLLADGARRVEFNAEGALWVDGRLANEPGAERLDDITSLLKRLGVRPREVGREACRLEGLACVATWVLPPVTTPGQGTVVVERISA